ncbi:flocculation-associated PEP-CTERM protein PepA [Massilia sp. S19_KUP03_FR1]|uniref:flocculation-associated PEP-CTERM protein PepA n=1 Tax=Massilia sp. S19_KUP03_FR1 TaxID=3025503 RepID=UPI002FCD992A
MKLFSKTILACSIAAASLFAGASAQAAEFNQFIINPYGTYDNFAADKITGNYVETATFNVDGTFNVSLYWKAGQFVTNQGTYAYDADETGLGNSYGIYALYKASGKYSQSGAITTFQFISSPSDSLELIVDTNKNNKLVSNASTGTGDFVFSNTTDDVVLASGDPLVGQGELNPALKTCGTGPTPGASGINCGSFGSTTTFVLTDEGKAFFISPTPFYNLSFQSGQLNNFPVGGTRTINGSLDVVFANEVPEPASLGLMGLGLLGLGFLRGRKQS